MSHAAGGPLLLALAATCVFAASMGTIDATVQSSGAQIAADVLAALRPGRSMSDHAMVAVSQVGIAVITLAAAVCRR